MTTATDAGALRARLLTALSPAVRDVVDRIIEAAGAPVYAVGGAVRDAVLGRPILDLDLATEADAVDVARRAFTPARITTHVRFRTASALIDGARVDVATVRRERYERPGALPAVERAGIEEDLGRRDFSINAMALRLDGSAMLSDPRGGMDDIASRQIRVLHEKSFRDDATRIFRAYRYAARLGFDIESHTHELLRDGVRYIESIGGERLRREIELILGEPAAGEALQGLAAVGALAAVHPVLVWPEEATQAYAGGLPDVPRLQYGFALLASRATLEQAAAVNLRLRLKRDEAEAVRGIAALQNVTATLHRPGAKPSGVVIVLDRYPLPSVAAYARVSGDRIARRLALRYLDEWRHVKPRLGGRDLQMMGVPPGPQMRQALNLLRAARLDGWADSVDDERALAARFVKSTRDAEARHAEADPDDR